MGTGMFGWKKGLVIGVILTTRIFGSGWAAAKHEVSVIEAAKEFNTSLVRELYENGADVNAIVDADNNLTALHWAAMEKHGWMVEYLCDKGAEINALTTDGRSPLHFAAAAWPVSTVIELCERGAIVNIVDQNGWTPLHWAAARRSTNVVPAVPYLCVWAGANIDIKTTAEFTYEGTAIPAGLTALDIARKVKNCDTEEYLENFDKTLVSQYREQIAQKAANSGRLEPLSGNNLTLMRMIFNKGVSINQGNLCYRYRALHHAVSNKRVLVELCKLGANLEVGDRDGRTPLHHAALKGSYEALVELCNRGANVNASSETWEKPLHIAAAGGRKEIVIELCNRQAEVKAKDKYGNTPLSNAAWNNQTEVMALLCKFGADVNAANEYGWTSLHTAAWKNHIAAAKELCKLEADFTVLTTKARKFSDTTIAEGASALDIAQTRGHHEIVAYLQEFQGMTNQVHTEWAKRKQEVFNCDENGWTPLHLAVWKNHMESIVELGKLGVDIDALTTKDCELSGTIIPAGSTALDIARIKHSEEIEEYLQHIPQLRAALTKKLGSAIFSGKFGDLQRLCMQGAGVNSLDSFGRTPLQRVAGKGNGNRKMIAYLCEQGADPNRVGAGTYERPPLTTAAQNAWRKKDGLEIIEELISQGAIVDAPGPGGHTALHRASGSCHPHGKSVVACLCNNGANVNAANSSGHTVLHWAARGAHDASEIIKELCSRGAEVNAETSDGQTPLHWAVSHGKHEAIEELCNQRANVNAQDHAGRTPLHLAAVKGDLTLVVTLCNCKALLRSATLKKIAINNNKIIPKGSTALDIARLLGHAEIEAYLIQKLSEQAQLKQESEERKHLEHEETAEQNTQLQEQMRHMQEQMRQQKLEMEKLKKQQSTSATATTTDGSGSDSDEADAFSLLFKEEEKKQAVKAATTSTAATASTEELTRARKERKRAARQRKKEHAAQAAARAATLAAQISSSESGSGSDSDEAGALNNLFKEAEHATTTTRMATKEEAWTLLKAAEEGDLATIQAIVETGVDVDSDVSWGSTMLHEAAKGNHIDLIHYLYDEKKANVNAIGFMGLTPLISAVEARQTDAVNYLCSCGADVNIQDECGRSALMMAVIEGDLAIVELLCVEQPSFDRATTKDLTVDGKQIPIGSTALDIARILERAEIVAYLEQETS